MRADLDTYVGQAVEHESGLRCLIAAQTWNMESEVRCLLEAEDGSRGWVNAAKLWNPGWEAI